MITLSTFDLVSAGVLVVLLALLNWRLGLGETRTLLVAAVRTVVQLLLIGLVLKALFAASHWVWVSLLALFMLAVAGREVMVRQNRRFRGLWGYGIGTSSMFLSSFSVTILTLTVIVAPHPWYEPQYAIPLLGMLLGNTMTGVALGLDRLTQAAWRERPEIEARLMLGHPWHAAIAHIRRESARSGLMPMINALAAAGIVSLPGMMTGQILAGAPPMEAVKYQILIMFLISAGSGFGGMAAVWLGSKRLFDQRDRLRLDRLTAGD